MGEEEKESEKLVASESPLEPPPAPAPEAIEEDPKDVAEEKSVIQAPPPEQKPDDSKALALVEKVQELVVMKSNEGSMNRDAVLANVATQKRMSLIRAWEESEFSKSENKANKKLAAVAAWESSKIASVEAELKKIEEKLEKKKAEYVEKMKNKIALVHKLGEEKRAIIEATRGEDLLKAEESAANYRATGTPPKKLLGCFSA